MSENQVEKRLGILTAWVTAGLAFILMSTICVMGIMVWQSYRVAESAAELRSVATETHNSLCTLKLDIQHRYEAGLAYQHDHPHGLTDSSGNVIITAVQLKQSTDAQKSTLDSLTGLDCS